MRTGWLLATLAVAASLASCGGGETADDDQAQITATLERLFQAQRDGDAETACNDLYAIQEPDAPGGDGEGESESGEAEEGDPGECEAAFERAHEQQASQVSDLQTEIGAIDIEGDRATATVRTQLTRAD